MPYTPDPQAPKEGTWDRTGPEPRWAQQHETLVRDALHSWKGDTAEAQLHLTDEDSGAPTPASGSGKIKRAQAQALLWELLHKSKRAPALFRGAFHKPSGWRPWSSSRKIAEHWAAKRKGQVYELAAGAQGIRIADYLGADPEKEWIVWSDPSDAARVASRWLSTSG